MSVNTDRARLDEIFNRGIVAEILPAREELFARLTSGERLKIYLGLDPTSDALHLSHAKNFWFLEELRQLGHEAIVLIGDFTAGIGDPSGRLESRPPLATAAIQKNVAAWLKQLSPLLDFSARENPPRLVYNSVWLGRLSLGETLSLAANFTVGQMLERDMFEQRRRAGAPVYLHEFLYPLLQGYDSVALEADIELCGTDQIFNALAGRTLLRRLKNKNKSVIALNLMANPKTGELMSKSRGAGVFLSSPPDELFGSIMALPDEMIEVLYVNCTRLPLEAKDEILSLGPRLAKVRVAQEIVEKLAGAAAARRAAEVFEKVFGRGGRPAELPEVELPAGSNLAKVLVAAGLVASQTEWRRLIKTGAVEDERGNKISDPNWRPAAATVLKIGKRRFVRVVPSEPSSKNPA